MEFVDENRYHSRSIINLKNKSPFDASKTHNKKALSDVGNVIHAKGSQSINLKPTHSKIGYSFDQQIKSPKPQSITQKSKKLSVLENMNEEFFTCACLTHEHDDFLYELPDCMQLSKKEIDIFATRWSNPAPRNGFDDLDVPLEIVPVSDDFLVYGDDAIDLSFMDVLNESLIYVPEITVPDVE